MKRLLVRTASSLVWDWGLIHVWKRLPVAFRRRLVGRMVRLPARSGAVPEGLGAPCHLVGLASSTTSLGWAFRACARTLRARGLEPIVWDVAQLFGSGARDGAVLGPVHDEASGGSVVLCVNPNQIAYTLSSLPPDLIHGRRLIGYFVWELERIPEAWEAPSALMDEIWAPTEFVADAFRRGFPDKPVRVIPYDITVPEGVAPDRARFDLPKDKTLVLAAANLQSGNERKNLTGSIAAFTQAFAERDDVHLVLKLHHGGRLPERRGRVLAALPETGVHLIEDDLTDAEMWSLIASCDVILSLHRSEGYGLLMKQGLMLGLQVVATGWSGNVDFMADAPGAHLVDMALVPVTDEEGVYPDATQRWAEPDVDHAAHVLRRIAPPLEG